MKKIKLPTVTVAISAYNEGTNIKKFLESVLMQKEEGFLLEKILIFSDGSTDNTVKNAKKVNSKKILVIVDGKRVGKSKRLNEIYKMVNSDFLVQSDADVVFAHKNIIRDMISPLIHSKKIGMSGGNPTPVLATTFTEMAINQTFEVYAKLRGTLRGGNNIFSVDGRILAYRKSLYKQFYIPVNMIANDAYTFFACLTKGFKYKYVSTGIVWFRSPQNLNDQIRQNTRFTAAPLRMNRLFPEKIVQREYHIPWQLKYKYMLFQFVKNPFACLYIYIVNLYCKVKARRVEKELTAKWAMAETTKKYI